MQLSHSELATVSAAVRELYAHTEALTLPHCMVRLVRGLIASDSAAYNHIDYQSHQIEVIHDHGAEADRLMPALNAHIDQHPVLRHWQLHGSGEAAKLSDFLSRRQLRDTGLYQEFFGPLNVQEQIGIFVEEKGRVAITLSLQRGGTNFTERERDLLAFLRPHFVQAYKNAVELSSARTEALGLKGALSASNAGVIWLGCDETVEWISNRAEAWLRAYFEHSGGGRGMPPAHSSLPAPLLDWLRTVKGTTQGAGGPGLSAHRQFIRARGQLTVRWRPETPNRSYLLLSESLVSPPPEMLVTLGLTLREAEVLHWVAEGKSNEAIALLLSLSRRTIEKHVERILAKLAVETRVEAALRAAAYRRDA